MTASPYTKIETTSPYTKIEPAPISLHEKKKNPARIEPELTIVVTTPSPFPKPPQITNQNRRHYTIITDHISE